MNCRYCELPIEGDGLKTFSYWSKAEFVCHADCKQVGERDEALDCQSIDADCNDCKHYQRGEIAPKLISLTKMPDGRIVEVVYKPEVYVNGRCLKFDKPMKAFPNFSTGHECFEHRRA